MLTKRSHELEWMDLGKDFYNPLQYRDCLFQLDRIGRFLGGDRATFWALRQLPSPPHSILDVGCGGGLFTITLAKAYPGANIVGLDISPEAIAFAKERLNSLKPSVSNVSFILSETPRLNEQLTFDVVTATLVCHHLSDEELIEFIKQACRTAKQAVILNDLHRHLFATIGFAAAVPLFFRNKMIWHDGLLSIRRSFKRQEWVKILNAAGVDTACYTITWHWAFRWIVTIDVKKCKGDRIQ